MLHPHAHPADSASLTALDQRESGYPTEHPLADAVIDRAAGCVLVSETGRRCIDFVSGNGVLNYGHNDPDMRDALVRHLQQQGVVGGTELRSTGKQRFIKVFSSLVLAPRNMSHRLRFTGPGPDDALAEAVALARRLTGREAVVAFTHSHVEGQARVLGPLWRHAYDGSLGEGVNTAQQLQRLLQDHHSGLAAPAAIVLECVQAQGGLRAASARWVREVAALARQHGALLIMDDRLAGGGRCGGFFSFEGMGVMPDLVVPTWSLSGMGLPLGLLLVRPDRDWPADEAPSGALRPQHLACVTAAVACEKFWADGQLQNAVAQRAALLIAGLQGVAALLPAAADGGPRVVGRGLLQGLRMPSMDLAREVVQRCGERGLVLRLSDGDAGIVQLMPPLTMSALLLEQGVALLHRAVADATGQKARSEQHRALAAVHRAARGVPSAAADMPDVAAPDRPARRA